MKRTKAVSPRLGDRPPSGTGRGISSEELHLRIVSLGGHEQVDNFFKKTANKLAKTGNLRVYVMVAADGDVIGFYAINAHAVDYQELPKAYARSQIGRAH